MAPAGRDVVGGDRVAQLGQHPGAGDVARPARAPAPCPRSTGACGRRWSPGPTRRCCRSGSAAPATARRRRRRRVGLLNMSSPIAESHDVVDLLLRRARCRAGRPACRPGRCPAASLGDVDVHGAGERVGDDQRRGGQVVHLDVGVDPALEVAVAGEHRGDREVVLVDGLGDLLRQRAGVADAGGAAVADEVEAELVQVRGQAGPLVVVGDDLGAGGQRGLDPRLAGQALLDRLLGQQRGADHDVRVGGVGAGGDRGDR